MTLRKEQAKNGRFDERAYRSSLVLTAAWLFGAVILLGLAIVQDASAAEIRVARHEEEAQQGVKQIIIKLRPSHANADDSNDPARVHAVLLHAFVRARVSNPGNPFSTRASQAEVMIHHRMSGGASVIALGKAVTLTEAQAFIAVLLLDKRVEYAEPNSGDHKVNDGSGKAASSVSARGSSRISVRGSAAPSMPFSAPLAYRNDPFYADHWHLHDSEAGINAPAAWATQEANTDIVTAIIDTGYTTHEDLDANRLSTGLTMLRTHGIVNDDARDLHKSLSRHGTKIAGLISAVSDNSIGVAAVGSNAKFIPINVFSHDGDAAVSDVADAMRWAAGMAVPEIAQINPHPARIINVTLESEQACGAVLQSAIDDVTARGITVVAAAGNQNMAASRVRPANCRNVITVGASNRTGERLQISPTDGSNFGPEVDISAPAEAVQTTAKGDVLWWHDMYHEVSGTSFAAPQVSGVIALMLSANPHLTPLAIKHILTETARMPNATSTPMTTMHDSPPIGILDAGAAVLAAQATRGSCASECALSKAVNGAEPRRTGVGG